MGPTASDHTGFAARIVGVADRLRSRNAIDGDTVVSEVLKHTPTEMPS